MEREDVFRLLGCINTFHNYACLSTVYACGLRISEALSLQVIDIDGKRMMIHVHRGKGAKDRYEDALSNTILISSTSLPVERS